MYRSTRSGSRAESKEKGAGEGSEGKDMSRLRLGSGGADSPGRLASLPPSPTVPPSLALESRVEDPVSQLPRAAFRFPCKVDSLTVADVRRFYLAGAKAARRSRASRRTDDLPDDNPVVHAAIAAMAQFRVEHYSGGRKITIAQGARPYECDWPRCGRRFQRPVDLFCHRCTHTGERLYECPVCGHSFAKKSNLLAHIRGHKGRSKKSQGKQRTSQSKSKQTTSSSSSTISVPTISPSSSPTPSSSFTTASRPTMVTRGKKGGGGGGGGEEVVAELERKKEEYFEHATDYPTTRTAVYPQVGAKRSRSQHSSSPGADSDDDLAVVASAALAAVQAPPSKRRGGLALMALAAASVERQESVFPPRGGSNGTLSSLAPFASSGLSSPPGY